ncbi:MAG: hypothetical protein WC554_05975 [Clostridia bacterium]
MKKAIKLLKNDGLFECSSERQKTNGTLYFVDPKTMTGYSITKSGYCRRHTFNISNYGYRINHYQLNKTIQEKKNDRYGSYWTTIGRILEPGKYVKLAKQLLGPIEHWRKNN